MVRLALLMVPLLAFVGCKTQNPNYIADATTRCETSSQCMLNVSAPVCDTTMNGGTCVACTATEIGACGGKTPICTNDQCAACTQHNDCKDSNACVLDGSCAAVTQVAYVDPMGTDNPDCTKTAPCTKVTAALATRRPYIKLHGTTDAGTTVTIDNQNVALLADPGAVLTTSTSGTILQITGTSMVEIDDLQISGATGANNPAISVPAGNDMVKLSIRRATITENAGPGIDCRAGALTISRSTISSNLGGGISTGAIAFDITNTFIHHNGDSTNQNGNVGGASLNALIGSASRFEFNTVVDNQVRDSAVVAGGVLCDQALFMAPNNLIAHNFVGSSSTKANANTFGACTYPTSAIAQTVTAFNFKSLNSPYDYHIQANSSAIGQATTPSSIAIDFDGQPRPKNASDQGADQHTP